MSRQPGTPVNNPPESDSETENIGPRRSSRNIKGEEPDRYGEWVPHGGRPASSRRRRKSENDVLKSDEPEILQQSQRAGQKVTRSRASSVKSGRPKASKRVQIESEIAMAQIEEEESRLKFEYEMEQLQRQKRMCKLAVEMSKIEDEENDSQDLSSEESEKDIDFEEYLTPPATTVKPKKKQQNEPPLASTMQNPELSTMQPQSSQNLQESFAQFTKSLTDALVQVAQANKPREDQLGTIMFRQGGVKDLPIFNGEEGNWQLFISAFRRSTETGRFSNDENLYRLDKCLKGKAREAVLGLMVSPDNLEQIITVLERKFGQPTQIIEQMIDKVQAMPNLRDDRPDMIIDYVNAVEGVVATIKSLKKEQHLQNPTILKRFVSKLPFHLSLRWGEKVADLEEEGTEVDMTHYVKWLGRVARAVSSGNLTRSVRPETSSQNQNQNQQRSHNNSNYYHHRQNQANFHNRPHSQNHPNDYQQKRNDNSHRNNDQETVLLTAADQRQPRTCLVCTKDCRSVANCPKFLQMNVQDRWQIVKENSLCFSDLYKGHNLKTCKRIKSCGVNGCTKPHHSLLHIDESTNTERANKEPENREEAIVNMSIIKRSPHVILKILPLTLIGPNGSMDVYGILDDCSTKTMIDATTAKKLGFEGYKSTLHVTSTRSMSYTTESEVVDLKIKTKSNDQFDLTEVHAVKDLNIPMQSINYKKLQEQYSHLRKAEFEEFVNAKPKILIGEDNARLIVSREVYEGEDKNGPILSRTDLGWVVHGDNKEIKGRVDNEFVHLTVTRTPERQQQLDDIHNLVKLQFALELLGVKLCGNKVKSRTDERAEEIMNRTTTKIESRYYTGLLWKEDQVKLPQSKPMALRRLRSVEKKMDQDPKYAEIYCNKIQDYITKGYAHKLTPDQAAMETAKTFYLPHFGVVNPNKPNKLRIVFDAAAKSQGSSLNDHLLTGPDYFNSLPGVLFKFRTRKIAFCGDIREMFSQVKINSEDSCAQRFLWRGKNRSKPPETYEMTSMIFGAVSSPSSAQYIKNLNARNYQNQYPRAAESIIRRHYMDDNLDSCDTESETPQLIQDIIWIHQQASFEICNFITNSPSVMQSIPEKLRGKDLKEFSEDSNSLTERVLGMHWNPNTDDFTFKLAFHKVPKVILNLSRVPTKREVLQVVMSIFDPLGLLSNLTVKGKILLQDIWRSNTNWDDEIPADLNDLWNEYIVAVSQLSDIKIPRCYFKKLSSLPR